VEGQAPFNTETTIGCTLNPAACSRIPALSRTHLIVACFLAACFITHSLTLRAHSRAQTTDEDAEARAEAAGLLAAAGSSRGLSPEQFVQHCGDSQWVLFLLDMLKTVAHLALGMRPVGILEEAETIYAQMMHDTALGTLRKAGTNAYIVSAAWWRSWQAYVSDSNPAGSRWDAFASDFLAPPPSHSVCCACVCMCARACLCTVCVYMRVRMRAYVCMCVVVCVVQVCIHLWFWIVRVPMCSVDARTAVKDRCLSNATSSNVTPINTTLFSLAACL